MTTQLQLKRFFRTCCSLPLLVAVFRNSAATAAMLFIVLLTSCETRTPRLDQRQIAAIQDSVRQMAANVERDVTFEGTKAWLRYFDHSPHFYMASEGALVFPNIDSAAIFVDSFSRQIRSLQLQWSDIGVDPLSLDLAGMKARFHEIVTDTSGHQISQDGYCTALVELKSTGWQFRNLHWSAVSKER